MSSEIQFLQRFTNYEGYWTPHQQVAIMILLRASLDCHNRPSRRQIRNQIQNLGYDNLREELEDFLSSDWCGLLFWGLGITEIEHIDPLTLLD